MTFNTIYYKKNKRIHNEYKCLSIKFLRIAYILIKK